MKRKYLDDWTLLIYGVEEEILVYSIHGTDIVFRAYWKEKTPEEIMVQHSDCKKLKKMMIDRLSARYTLAWENKLHITIRSEIGDVSPDIKQSVVSDDAKIEIEIQPIQLSTLRDGSKISRKGGDSQAHCPGWPDEGEHKSDGWKEIDMQAFVDDTPENRAALQKLFNEFKKLNAALCRLMSPKNIQATLASVKAGNFLPAPKNKIDEVEPGTMAIIVDEARRKKDRDKR